MDNTAAKRESSLRAPLFPSTRLSVYVMLFVTAMLNYAIRTSLNMAVVCMVAPEQHNDTAKMNDSTIVNNQSLKMQCEVGETKKQDFGYEAEFHWSRYAVGHLLGAYFHGYLQMQPLGGLLADKFGIRHVLGTGMLIGGVLSLLTPIAARLHYGVLFAVRVLQGFSMGMLLPCVYSYAGKWVPFKERMSYLGIVFSGASAGSMFSYSLVAFMCPYSWTYVFYILGANIIFWYIGFLYTIFNTPEEHPRISENEKAYITEHNKESCKILNKGEKVPFKSFFKSPSVLALFLAEFSYLWMLHTVTMGIPLFMQDVLGFDIKHNGLLSSLPFLIQMQFYLIIGPLGDFIQRVVIKSRSVMRKSSQTIYVVNCALCIIMIGFLTCEQRMYAITMFCSIYFFACFKLGGSALSPVDIAPRMGGSVYGLVSFNGNLATTLVPITIGHLTTNGTQEQWQTIFFLCASIMAVGWLVFFLCVSSEEQPWAKAPEEEKVPDEEQNMKPLTEEVDLNDDELKRDDLSEKADVF